MQWEIESLQKIHTVDASVITKALMQLWKLNPDLHTIVVVNAYIDGKISLAKAAETLGLTRIEFERELRKRGIPVRTLSPEDVQAEVQAIISW
jgi:predicted HTH domain antitoxin